MFDPPLSASLRRLANAKHLKNDESLKDFIILVQGTTWLAAFRLLNGCGKIFYLFGANKGKNVFTDDVFECIDQ